VANQHVVILFAYK